LPLLSERVPEERLPPAGSTSSLLKQLALVATSSSSDWFFSQLGRLAIERLAIEIGNRALVTVGLVGNGLTGNGLVANGLVVSGLPIQSSRGPVGV